MPRATIPYIVGREEEVQLLSSIVSGALPYSIVNIFGPGGIGKTVVCRKFEEFCAKEEIPYAVITENDPARSSIDKMLYRFRQSLEKNSGDITFEKTFNSFDKKFLDYLAVLEVIERGGGISKIFDPVGNLLDNTLLKLLIKTVGGAYESLKEYFKHRAALERYIDGVNVWLTRSFTDTLNSIVEQRCAKVVLLLDGYENMGLWDDWMCNTFVKTLSHDAKVIILSRDRLNRENPDWSQYGKIDLHYHELMELEEMEAKSFLFHHGLHEEKSLDRVYHFTGGYPLCLVLAVDLANEVGWDGVSDFISPASRDRVANQLLDRILKQEKVKEVQEFLEKGVVARWFDPGAISYILQISPERGQEIYYAIGKFSFVKSHPLGLQFHERVRELLEDRLMFMDGGKTFAILADRWSEYLAVRAGVTLE